jgi:dTDP-4-amino-4,6-dideoxygalactose transaminase
MKIRNIAVPVEAVAVPFADCYITEEAQAAALRVLRSGWVTTGREVLGFETEFAAGVDARQAVAVSSCKAASEFALRSLGLAPGSPIVTSTMTFLRRRPGDSARESTSSSTGRREAAMESRDEVGAELSERGAGTSAHFIPVHRLAYFRQVALIPPRMTGADALFEQLPPLPIYPRLTDDQVDAVCTAIADTACRQFSRKGAE